MLWLLRPGTLPLHAASNHAQPVAAMIERIMG
jgi:hypothetical protein